MSGSGDVVVVRDRRRVKYFRVDNCVIDDYGHVLGPSCLAVYTALCRRANNDRSVATITNRRLGEDVGVGITTVKKCIRVLERVGLLHVQPRIFEGGQRANAYVLLEPPERAVTGGQNLTTGQDVTGAPSEFIPGAGINSDGLIKKTSLEEEIREEAPRLTTREVMERVNHLKYYIEEGWSVRDLIAADLLLESDWSEIQRTTVGRRETKGWK